MREALRAFGVMLGFVAFALGWAELEARAVGSAAPYPGPVAHPHPAATPTTWLVDGFNVLQVALLRDSDRQGWWREEARARLLGRAASFDDTQAEIWVIFDGARPAEAGAEPSARLRVAFAPSADAWMLARLRATPEPARVALVTADRRLAARARSQGARVVTPAAFLARCP